MGHHSYFLRDHLMLSFRTLTGPEVGPPCPVPSLGSPGSDAFPHLSLSNPRPSGNSAVPCPTAVQGVQLVDESGWGGMGRRGDRVRTRPSLQSSGHSVTTHWNPFSEESGRPGRKL